MPRNVLAYLSLAMALLLVCSFCFVSRQRKDTSVSTLRKDTSVSTLLRKDASVRTLRLDDGRSLKAPHRESDEFYTASVRVKKTPLASDSRKHDTALKDDRREIGKSSKGYKSNKQESKGGKGKSGWSSDSSEKWSGSSSDSSGKGKSGGRSHSGGKESSGKGKQKKSKSAKECSAGGGKGGKHGKGSEKWGGESAPSSEINCEDYDFLAVPTGSTHLGVSSATDLEECSRNVLEQAHSLPELSTFVQMVGMAGLTCLFHCGGPFTLLAPTNAAFADLNPEAMIELLRPENLIYLQELIMDHILPGFYLSADINPGSLITLLGKIIGVETNPLSFGKSNVITPDIVGYTATLGPTTNNQTTSFPTPAGLADPPMPSLDSANPPTSPPTPMVPTTVAPALVGPPPTESPILSPTVEPPGSTPAPVSTAQTLMPVAAPVDSSPAITVEPTVQTIQAPSLAPVGQQTSIPGDSLLRVAVKDVYLAFVAPGATATPTRTEFETVAQLTTNYFFEYLKTYYADDPDVQVARVESEVRTAKYGYVLASACDVELTPLFVCQREDAGVPEERYNLYLEFESITILLENGSIPPNEAEAVELLKGSISVDYILNIPRKMTGTSFESTNEAYFSATIG